MVPNRYPAVYLNIPAPMGDRQSTQMVLVRNYLQSGKGDQSTRAEAARDALARKIGEELGLKGPTLPLNFKIDDYNISSLSFRRVFLGKGAPDEIQDVLWLAARYKLVDRLNVQGYCDRNLGIDFGGFVSYLWVMFKSVLVGSVRH